MNNQSTPAAPDDPAALDAALTAFLGPNALAFGSPGGIAHYRRLMRDAIAAHQAAAHEPRR